MLKNEIKSVEHYETGLFSIVFKVTASNDETDFISVNYTKESLGLEHVACELKDIRSSSYKFADDKLSTNIEKTTGALKGGIFYLGTFQVNIQTKPWNKEIYVFDSGDIRTVVIKDFQIIIKLTDSLDKQVEFEILNENI